MKRTILLLSAFALVLMVPAVSAVGSVTVSSVTHSGAAITGATIYLNGASTGQTTPYTLTNVPNGSQTIGVTLTGYLTPSPQMVTVTDNQTQPVLFTLTSSPVISGISPPSGINNGPVTIAVTGTTFLAPVTVMLTNGSTSIPGANNAVTGGTGITSTFNLINAAPGTWSVVVINTDSGTATLQNGFTVISAASASTVSSITPASGTVNTTVSITNLAGNGFQSNAQMLLTRSGYNDIPGVENSVSPTQIVGTFNLNNIVPGSYTVCVLYDGTNRICGPAFTINGNVPVNGSIAFTSNPATGVGVFLNNVFKGTTPLTLYNITPGTYTVTFKLSGYDPQSKSYIVTAGQSTNAYGYLNANTIATTTAPVYTVPTTIPRTATTIKKSTAKVPTPWPTATPTKSPTDLLIVLGAVGLGVVVLRKP